MATISPIAGANGTARLELSTIVLGTDGSRHAARALDAAEDLARRLRATVHVVAAWDVVSVSYVAPAIASAVLWVEAEEEATKTARDSLDALRAAGVTEAVPHIVEGRAARRILEVAEDEAADLVVLGSRGRGPLQRLVMGSTSDEVVRASRCPVLLVRGGEGCWPPDRIVAAHDGSPAAHDAARLAGVVAAALGLPLHLVWVVPPLRPADPADPGGRGVAEARALLSSAAARIGDLVGVRPQVEVRVGDPVDELLRHTAGHSTLVAVGSRGDHPRAHHRLGSVASKILHAAEGPVLLVPPLPGL